MADLSIAVLVGRLTRDSELKYTNAGQPICHFSVATGTRRKKGDQWVDEPSFWDIDLWGKQAENLNQYLTKGKQVAIEGSMRQDRWEQDGQPRVKVIITANSVTLLGGGISNNDDRPQEPRREPPKQEAPAVAAVREVFEDLSDIPF